MSRIENGVELKDRNGENGKNGASPQQTEPKTVTQQIKRLFKGITVEPFLLCYILPLALSSATVQKFNMEKACRVDLGYSEDICNKAIGGESDDNITANALTETQVLVADMTAWQSPLQSSVPAIMILFIGAWSDRTGNRKTLMLMPVIGEIISAIGLLFARYFFLEWPLWATAVIEALPTALSGGLSVALMGAYSYVADVTTVEERTFRIGIVGIIVTLGIPLGTSISGILEETVGYYGIFGINAGLYILGFIHTFFTVRDVRRVSTEGTFLQKLKMFFNPLNAWASLSLLVLSPRKQLINIWLIVLAHIIVIGPVSGEGSVQFLYVLQKYGMDVVDYTVFVTCSILVGIAGGAICVTLFSKYLQMHDSLLGIIASTSKVTSSFIYGWAPTNFWFYSGPIFDLFGTSGTPVVRSLGTKVVKPEEIGKMASVIGFVEAIAPAIYTPMYTQIYTMYIDTVPGMFYIVGGIMTIPTIIIYIHIYIMYRHQKRDEVKNPERKEQYAHENAITVL
ncbi:proton-coupled folate transporter-like [Aricia agestis]|uniref:proton-coupled folate transporter-like n=1 Tax=Aricia agestis TaxID=91739 RepID=UPI001C205BCE|nr:proton-coupled folate transporter-like [Aricia agestis]